MDKDIAIRVENVSKVYKLYDRPVDRLKESINPLRKKYHKEFFALNDVSFEAKKGEAIGLIGKNGSGKSTLLKIITGVLSKTTGNIYIDGNISSLLELGAGFNPEYTGIENIYLYGTIMGYNKEQIDTKLDDILSFADLGDFITQPVKTYSSGMFIRLAFAAAVNVEPDIFIVDEALSVGDIRFQQKCFRRIDELSENKTVIFVTHDLGVINKFCNRVIWLNEGMIQADGLPSEVSKKYQAYMIDSAVTKYFVDNSDVSQPINGSIGDGLELLDDSLDVLGDDRARITGIGIFDAATNKKLSSVDGGRKVKIAIKVTFNDSIQNPIVGFTIKDRIGNIVTQTNSYILDKQLSKPEVGQSSIFCFEFVTPYLNDGYYSISPAIASGSQCEHTQHSWVHDALVFQITTEQKHRLQGYLVLRDTEFYEVE